MATNQTIKSHINKRLNLLCSGVYHPQIPLDKIFHALQEEGINPLQEDGTAWEGFLCGEQGSATIQTSNSKIWLHLDWYQMPSKRFEVNAYVS